MDSMVQVEDYQEEEEEYEDGFGDEEEEYSGDEGDDDF